MRPDRSSSGATQRVSINIPARCVQAGDQIDGVPVRSVEPWTGKAVWITRDDGKAFGIHMDDFVRVVRYV